MRCASLTVRGKSLPWPFSTWATPENAKGFRGCRSPHPAADALIHGLLTAVAWCAAAAVIASAAAREPGGAGDRERPAAADRQESSRESGRRDAEVASRDPTIVAIDRLIEAQAGERLAARSTDAEFIRRVYLDLAGTIPSADDVRAFLASSSPDKRRLLVDSLLAAPSYARRMRHAVDVCLIQRRTGVDVPPASWDDYLEDSFAHNKPWDQFVRELIGADGTDPATAPAMNFLLSRGATSHHEQAIDVGRLLLGRDFECAQCHNHPSVSDYKQADFYGLVAFLNRSYLYEDGKTRQKFFTEKGLVDELKYSSAFTGEAGIAAPHLPGKQGVDVPQFAAGEELAQKATEGRPPIPKVALRPQLAQALATGENAEFTRNAANRFWALMMGRGLVHPLEMHHANNPPSHPELLAVLSDGLAAGNFDVKAFLRRVARSEAYQRSSLMPEGESAPLPESFAAANTKPLSAEQLAYSVLQATGNLERVLATPADPDATAKYRPDKGQSLPAENLGNVLKLFRSIYAAQPGETEDAFNPSLSAALFLSNEKLILSWLSPQPGNLLQRLLELPESGDVAEEMYLSILSREPTPDERADVEEYLRTCSDGRETALREMAWALLASAEFRLNH
jgi:hypothetical protein